MNKLSHFNILFSFGIGLILSLWTGQAAAQEVSSSAWTCAEERSAAAQKTSSEEEIRKLTLEGMMCADECLKKNPNESHCFYYRAVNRGLLLETGLANPKPHLKSLVDDFKRAAELAPTLDGAGPLRALGYIYLKLPAASLWGEGYSRDLDKAKTYAAEALRVDDAHPENWQLAGEIAFAEKDFKTAKSHFKAALKRLKKAGAEKESQIQELEKWIHKSELKLKK